MPEIPTGNVIKPYDRRENDRSVRDEIIEAVEAYDPDVDPLPDRVEVVELRADDLVANAWSGFVTSQLPDMTVGHDRMGFGMGRPRKRRGAQPSTSPITPHRPSWSATLRTKSAPRRPIGRSAGWRWSPRSQC